jgi:hypothetical protein
MIRTLIALTAVFAATAPQIASADTVCEWMEFAGRIADKEATPAGGLRTPGHIQARTQVALAMFEALNAIDRRYESYLKLSQGISSASQHAAAVTAAHRVLLHHFPAQTRALDENYAIALESEADLAARNAGISIGEEAAKAAIAAGGIDPEIAQIPYRPRVLPGEWTATALPVFEPFDVAFRPWILTNIADVRPPAPPAITSNVYARDLAEVQRVGGRSSTARTPNETLMARYRITPDMMPSLRLAADAPGRSLVQNARMITLVQMATDDAYMATAAAKLHYNYWRPIVAIRNADQDGNDATTLDPAWTPLINTPNHPEYPCGHCTQAGAIAEVMTAETGARPFAGVRVTSRSLPEAAVQVLPSWDEWVKQVNYSRILGGVHYRFSNDAGEKVGRDVAKLALVKLMRPLSKDQVRPAAK